MPGVCLRLKVLENVFINMLTVGGLDSRWGVGLSGLWAVRMIQVYCILKVNAYKLVICCLCHSSWSALGWGAMITICDLSEDCY